MDSTRGSLLIRIKDGRDVEAWEEFHAIYRPLLYKYARARGLGHPDAEDVVQHCMAAIAKHIQGFDYDPQKGRFRSWLRTLVNNRVTNLLRTPKDAQANSRDLRLPQETEESPDDAFDRLWKQEHYSHCFELVRREVKASTFKAFDCYVIQEWPAERVCQELGMNREQLYAIKWRVTKKLREKMDTLLAGTE